MEQIDEKLTKEVLTYEQWYDSLRKAVQTSDITED